MKIKNNMIFISGILIEIFALAFMALIIGLFFAPNVNVPVFVGIPLTIMFTILFGFILYTGWEIIRDEIEYE